MAIDDNNTLPLRAHPLMAELKLKVLQYGQFSMILMYLISSLPPEGTFPMSKHFYHLWPLGQKATHNFLKDGLPLYLSRSCPRFFAFRYSP